MNKKRANASSVRPLSLTEMKSAVLEPAGLGTDAALRALGVRHRLAEACDVFVEAGLVFPDFRRCVVIALRLHALDAVGKQGWELLNGVFELGHRGVDRGLIVGF